MIFPHLLPTILNMSLTAGGVILFVLVIRLAIRKAPKVFSYALWAVVLFRLLCPISVTSDFSLLRVFQPPLEQSTPIISSVAYVRPEGTTPAAAVPPAIPVGPTAAPAEPERAPAETISPSGEQPPAAAEPPVTFLGFLWLAGALAMVGYSLVSLFSLRRKLVGAVPLWDNVYLADHIASPFVIGILRPKIYLPSTLSQREQGYILLHEQYHIRRGDHIAKVLAFAALSIHWFNPLVWAAFILAGKDMEMSCDEAVVKQLGEEVRQEYSASLLSLATGRHIIAGTPLAFGEGDPKGRIQNIMRWKKPDRKHLLGAAALCAVVIMACACNPQNGGAKTGAYESMEAYAEHQAQQQDTLSLDVWEVPGSQLREEPVEVSILDRTIHLSRQTELRDLDPDGVLEVWTYGWMTQLDLGSLDPDSLALPENAYLDENHALNANDDKLAVALRYPDGSYDILEEQLCVGSTFYGDHLTMNEALYDWYVLKNQLDLPLYVEDWIDRLDFQAAESYPVSRYDGDGWYVYIPQTWTPVPVDAILRRGSHWEWMPSYESSSYLVIDHFTQNLADSQQVARKQSYQPVDEDHLVWELRQNGTVNRYYFREAPDGGCWRLQTSWEEEAVSKYPYTAIEPEVLELMAESFTPDDRFVWVDLSLLEQGLNQIFIGGLTYDTASDFPNTCNLTASGMMEDCEIPLQVYSNYESTPGKRLVSDFHWTMAPSDTPPGHHPYTLHFENDGGSVTVYSDENRLDLEVDGQHTVWLGSSCCPASGGDVSEVFLFLRPMAEEALYHQSVLVDCSVSGKETDYEVIARQLAEQFTETIPNRPQWHSAQAQDARLTSVKISDVYYGEDAPSFCFWAGLDLQLDDSQVPAWDAGASLAQPETADPADGYYGWGTGFSVERLDDGNWHITGTGDDPFVKLPISVESATPQQLIELYFLTDGTTHNWLIPGQLVALPLEQLQAQMKQLAAPQRDQLKQGIRDFLKEYPDSVSWSAADLP